MRRKCEYGFLQVTNARKVFPSHEAKPSDLERLFWHEWLGKTHTSTSDSQDWHSWKIKALKVAQILCNFWNLGWLEWFFFWITLKIAKKFGKWEESNWTSFEMWLNVWACLISGFPYKTENLVKSQCWKKWLYKPSIGCGNFNSYPTLSHHSKSCLWILMRFLKMQKFLKSDY